MKKITILSIQHTGTFFASKTLAAAYPDSHLRTGSLYEKHIKAKHKRYTKQGATELSDFVPVTRMVPNTFFDDAVLSVCPEEKIKDKDIIIGHEHFHKANSWILKALQNAPSGCPIIVPVRDPLLSLHSKIWREIEEHNNKKGLDKKNREHRLNKWIALFYDILSIPQNHIFHLPIDAEQSKSENTRIKLIEEMYTYCNIPFNSYAQEAAKNWKPTNTTYSLIKRNKKNPSPRWENFKERYLAGDIKHTKAIMGMEFERLQREEKLKGLMEQVGYKNVLWW